MDIEEINRKIQQIKDRYKNKINQLEKTKVKETEHYNRDLRYWQRQKEQVKSSKQCEKFDVFINNIDNLVKQALED